VFELLARPGFYPEFCARKFSNKNPFKSKVFNKNKFFKTILL